jgi:hypothetical protein
MNNNDVTIITADFMYLLILGVNNKLDDICNFLNTQNKNNNTNIRYVSNRIDTPCVDLNNNIINLFNGENEYIEFAEGVEQAQTLTFAEGYNKSYKILFEVEKFDSKIEIRYPKLSLEDETEPEKLISSWIKKLKLVELMEKIIIRPVNIVGNVNEILVFAARINNE